MARRRCGRLSDILFFSVFAKNGSSGGLHVREIGSAGAPLFAAMKLAPP
jgi:hypothetical protein